MAEHRVVGGDHDRVAEQAEAHERLLHVDRRDLLAAALDDVVLAALDPDEAVGVGVAEVAGAEAVFRERRSP